MGAVCCSSISRSDKCDDKVQLAQNSSRDDDYNSDYDDGGDGAELLDAALKNKRGNAIESILRNDMSLIRAADPMGDTFLHVAARIGNEWAVLQLISFMKQRPYLKGMELKKVFTDVNFKGDTALHLALRNGHQRVAYYLVKEEKEAATIVNNDGVTPFQIAKIGWYSRMCASMAYRPCVELDDRFLSFQFGSVDVELRAMKEDLEDGSISVGIRWAQIYAAIKRGKGYVVATELMRNRNDTELLWHKDDMGETLLHAALRTEAGMGPLEELVYFLIRNRLTAVAHIGNVNGDTALHLAVQKEDLAAINFLIRASPQTLCQTNHKGDSPLSLAIKADHRDLVKYMCQTLTEMNCDNTTLLRVAIAAKASGTLQTLLEHLPGLIKGTDEKGWRPLSYAAYKGYLDEVTFLLTNFPKYATKYDKDGSLPIHKAVGGGHVSIIQTFLEHCPQTLHHVDRKGRSVLHVAVRYARADILSYMTKNFNMEDSFLNLRDNDGKKFTDYTKKLKHYLF